MRRKIPDAMIFRTLWKTDVFANAAMIMTGAMKEMIAPTRVGLSTCFR